MSLLIGRPTWRSSDPDKNALNAITLGLYQHDGLILGSGKSASYKSTSLADKNFISFYLGSSAPSGTSRGMYLRLYLTGGAGGEALRAFCTVSSNTPADSVNGAHISLNFGSSAGNVTGLGTAVRATVHVPNRSLGGTGAALQAELYSDGASSTIGGKWACVRLVNGGNATGIAAIDDTAYALSFSGFTGGSGNVIGAAGDEPTWATGNTVKIRCWDETGNRALYLIATLA
jgi:hypothetical protein